MLGIGVKEATSIPMLVILMIAMITFEIMFEKNYQFAVFRIYRKPKKKSKYCRKFIGQKNRKRTIRIGTKTSHLKVFHARMSTLSTTPGIQDKTISFQPEGFEIGIDNHCSRTMSHSTKDFVGHIRPMQGVLNGVNGKLSIKGVGTVKWEIFDDIGKRHVILIKDSLYLPGLDIQLLSPQHWAQQSTKKRYV